MSLFSLLDCANDWIASHKELTTVLAVPSMTWLVTHLVNRSVEKRATEERKVERALAREMKLSEYRQTWINELRHELASFSEALAGDPENSDDVQKLNYLAAKLQLLMNPDDPLYEDYVRTQGGLVQVWFETGDLPEVHRLTTLGQTILKTEWDRLKADMQLTEANDQ